MIDFSAIDSAVVRGLAAHMGKKVIEANTAAKLPPYPFISYEFIDLGDDNDALPIVLYKDGKQVSISTVEFTATFNACAKTKVECAQIALKARDWFIGPGNQVLKDLVNVVVFKVDPANNRDIQVGDEWERRFGFDVEFRTVSTIESPEGDSAFDYIEKASIQEIEGDD